MGAKTLLSFYADQGPFSDPGAYAELFSDLPCDMDALCGIVNGLIVHNIWANIGQLQLPDERKNEIHIRSTQDRLANLIERDARPLVEARDFSERQLGCCRDEALLLCSFLRYFGIPARVRKGFILNFGPDASDHAVCQVWSPNNHRWMTVDVQVDNMIRESRRLPPGTDQFLSSREPHDTSPAHFLTGGQAWLKCRAGEADPNSFSIEGDLRGWWFIRHNLLRDLLALNKYELLCWDNIP
jgi:hypothetical protein